MSESRSLTERNLSEGGASNEERHGEMKGFAVKLLRHDEGIIRGLAFVGNR